MNSSLKYVEFLQNQSQTSPSFKNLRIESDSPTISNYFQQIINSQQTVGNKILSSETPTMKKTQSIKNNFQVYKIEQNEGHLNQQIDEQNAIMELEQDLKNQDEFVKANGQVKKTNIFENEQYNFENVDIKKEDFTNSFSELKHSKESEHFFEDNDANDIQIQSSTDHSRILQESSQKKQRYLQGSDNSKQLKIENKKRGFDLTKQLFYDKDLECKYNQNTNSYSGNCSLHNQEMFHFLCFSCSELICNECVNIHVGHQIQTIENSYPYCKRNIQSILDILNQKIEKMLIHSEDLTSIQNDVIETYQQQKHEIERAYKALIQSIKAQSTELLEYCSKLYHENYDYIINQHYNLRQELSKMIESYRIIEKNMAINDQFITCDYYLKKMKLINSIINAEKAEMNQLYQSSPSSSFYLFNMNDQFKALNVSQLYQNSRLNINDQIMTNYLEREFVQLKINLGKLDLKVENQKNMMNEQMELEDRSTSRFNAESNFESPGSNKIQTKNYFMSLQSSPQSRQSFNQMQNQVSQIQKNQIMKQSGLLFQKCNKIQNQDNFSQQVQQFKRTFLPSHIQNKIQQLKLFDKQNQSQYYINSNHHQQQDNFLLAKNSNQICEMQQNVNHFNSTSSILNSEAYKSQIQQITSHFKNIPYKDKLKLEIKTQNTYLNASNITNLSNNSSRNIIATTKSHSPNKFYLGDNSEQRNSFLSQNKEPKIILSSPNQENPLLQINSEKAEKDISSRDSFGSNKQYKLSDDKQRLKLSMSPRLDLNHDLFSISRRNKSFILPDQNKDINGVNKFNKEIEEIKSILYQEPSQQIKKTPRNQNHQQNKVNYKNHSELSPINSLFAQNASIRECDKFYNKCQYQNDKSSSFISKPIREERDKSPNFFQYKTLKQNFNSQADSVPCLTPKYDNVVGSLYNQAQNEKFLNSHFQLEGILNTIGKTDNKFYTQNTASKGKNLSNLENLIQTQHSSSNLSPSSQSFLNFLGKNSTPFSSKISQKQSVCSILNHQFEESPLNKIQKGKWTEQLVQNFIKQKFQNQFVENKKEQR
ncbi:hypothetical protein ABPG72_006403 [Tetrahymena utriculariae]